MANTNGLVGKIWQISPLKSTEKKEEGVQLQGLIRTKGFPLEGFRIAPHLSAPHWTEVHLNQP